MDAFRKGKFELLALTKIKLKGNGEVNGIISGVQEIEREGGRYDSTDEQCVGQRGHRLGMC